MDILNHIDLTIPDHKLVVFTGPNGGGKTTLAKVIMGLVQPTEGQILYNGQDVTGLSITERARLGNSYGFQQPPASRGSPSMICFFWRRAAKSSPRTVAASI